MEALITTLTIDRETEKLISTTESYEEIRVSPYANEKFDEFLDMMADEFLKFKKAQKNSKERGHDEKS